MKDNKAYAFEVVFKGIALKAPLWAMLIVLICGTITWGMLWFIRNVIEPSINTMEKNKTEEVFERISN